MNDITTLILTSFFSAIFGAFCTFIVSERTRRCQQFNQAAAQFRSAFIEQLVYLRGEFMPEGIEGEYPSDLCTFLRSNMLKSLNAIEIFKPHLSINERKAIEDTWENYCYYECKPQNSDDMPKMAFMAYFSLEDNEKKECIALQQLEKIL